MWKLAGRTSLYGKPQNQYIADLAWNTSSHLYERGEAEAETQSVELIFVWFFIVVKK